jgi:Ca2+-binding RTX toxin-like protein
MDVESTYGSLVGDNTLTGNPLDNILVGGAGSDQLSGQSGNDILVGGDGDDILVGSDGRDILIGGFGADNVTGSNGEDILVGGRTAYDYSPALSYIGADGLTHAYRGDFTYEALRAIRAEWSSSRDYATRIANLSNRPGQTSNRVNGAFFLIGGLDTSADGTVASNDGATDKLTGSNDKDWFFTESTRDITDLKANEKTEI